MQTTINQVNEEFSIYTIPSADEIVCPIINDYVNREFCHSFFFGAGCKLIPTCPSYQGVDKT